MYQERDYSQEHELIASSYRTGLTQFSPEKAAYLADVHVAVMKGIDHCAYWDVLYGSRSGTESQSDHIVHELVRSSLLSRFTGGDWDTFS